MPTTEQQQNAERIGAAFTAHEDPDQLARSAVDRGVVDIVRQTAGPDAFRVEPLWAGASSTHSVPDTAAAVRAASKIRNAAANEFDRLVRQLRAEGSSWDQVGEVLGYGVDDDHGDGDSRAERAFYTVAPPRGYDESTAYWKCNGCGQGITDRGPFNPHPVDQERGHRGFTDSRPGAPCPRFAAEIAAYEKTRGDW